MEAAKKGDTTAVRAALEKLPPDSETVVFDAVHETCRGNHDECLALLLPYVETTQVGFGTLLSACVHADHVACTEVLLQHWKSVCKNEVFVRLKTMYSARVCPAMWSDPAVCRILIDAGADIETKDERGCSPLHSACNSGALGNVKMLVEAGAGVNVTDNEGSTCLQDAAGCGHIDTVRYLVGLPEVDVNTGNYTALHYASAEGDADVVQLLIDAGADIEIKNSDGRCPLHNACEAGALDNVKMLVRAGAGVNVTDNKGDTCLTVAAIFGHTETVRYLVGLPEVEINHGAANNDTALHRAGQKACTDVVRVLIDAGADVEIKNAHGRSPLHCALEVLDIVKMLVEAGAGVRDTDDEGDTCLTLAAYFGQTETVRYLVGLPEVEMNHRDGDNKTALQCAVEENQKDMVQVLIAAGADMDTENTDGRSPNVF